MKGYNWEFDFNPQFSVHFFPYEVVGDRDCMHWHRYYEIGLCTGGGGKFVYFNKEYAVEKGDIFISNNYESHVAMGLDNQSSNYIFLIFLPSFIAVKDGRWVDRQYLATFNYNPLKFINRIPASTQYAQHIAEWIQHGLSAYVQKERGYQMEIDIIIRQILLECTRYYYSKEGQSDVDYFGINPRIRAAQEYINNAYTGSLTIEQVAKHVGVNPSYFRHLFKAETQISFKEYITYLRLSRARTLLLASDRSINRVIEEVGYTNISQFYRVFKQHYNMTPAQYRELNRDAII